MYLVFCPPFIWTLFFHSLLLSYATHGLLLQPLLLNLGEDGKIVGALLVQKKTSMLFDGNSANSCCNLENIRYSSFLLGNVEYQGHNSSLYCSYKMIVNCMIHYRKWCRICWNMYHLILLFIINVFLILFVGTRAASVHWRDCVLLYLSQARYGGSSFNWPFSHIHCYLSCYYHFCSHYTAHQCLYRRPITPFDLLRLFMF